MPSKNQNSKERVEALKPKLAGISIMSLAALASRDDLEVGAGGPGNEGAFKGKYMAWVTLGKEDHYRPLVNIKKPFQSKADATAAAQEIVDAAREIIKIKEFQDEMPPLLKALLGITGPTAESKIVREVIDAAH